MRPRFEDEAAARYLQGEGTVRDGALVALTLTHPDREIAPAISLVFEVQKTDGVLVYKLALSEVTAFGISYEANQSYWISHFKCAWSDSEGLYISLDPYDEREPPSDDDNDYFRARHAELKIEAKGGLLAQ